jgi:hypothetical protein
MRRKGSKKEVVEKAGFYKMKNFCAENKKGREVSTSLPYNHF